jgi:hypothetical protein
MGRTHVTGVVFLAVLALLGCDAQSTAPAADLPLSTQRAHDLELSLRIDPASTAPGGDFTAIFTITNRRSQPTTLVSGCIVLARGVVYAAGDEERQSFIGTADGCFTALSSYQLDVGETFEQVWHATAANRVYLGDLQWEINPALEGDYVFRVSPDVITIDREAARLPELEVAFRVQ